MSANTHADETSDADSIVDEEFAEWAAEMIRQSGRLGGIDPTIYQDGALKRAFALEYKAEQEETRSRVVDPADVCERVVTRLIQLESNAFVDEYYKTNTCTSCGLGIAGAETRTRPSSSGRVDDEILVCSRCGDRLPTYQ